MRIEDREVTPAEKEEVENILKNPRRLAELENGALRNPRVYWGRKVPEDLGYHQLRNLACAALLPKNGLHAVYDEFGGDSRATKRGFEEAAKRDLAPFMDFLRDKGGDGRVLEDHPAFADAATWSTPVVSTQGMCLQAGKRPFYHETPTTVTGKIAKACNALSLFGGGPISKTNRTLFSCLTIVTDGDGSAIPHCTEVRQLRGELREGAEVVEAAWMQAVLHNFPNTPAVGTLQGRRHRRGGTGS